MLCIRREDGRILEANAAAEEAYGYSRDELLALTIFDLRVPGTRTYAERQMATAARRSVLFETLHQRRDGSVFPVEVSSQRIPREPGTLISVVRDITRRKRADSALRESEERIRLLADFAPVGMAMFDREMRYLAVSRRFRQDYGLGDRDLIGRSYYEIFPDTPERWKAVHARCLEGASESNPGEPFPRQDGATSWIRWEMRPWRHEDGYIGRRFALQRRHHRPQGLRRGAAPVLACPGAKPRLHRHHRYFGFHSIREPQIRGDHGLYPRGSPRAESPDSEIGPHERR